MASTSIPSAEGIRTRSRKGPFFSVASTSSTLNFDADVIVIGGGLSGLNAAQWLEKGQQKVIILEARDRLGGRTCTETQGDFSVDLGGAYVGPTQYRLNALAERFGIKKKPVFTQGKRVVEASKTVSSYTGVIPWSMGLTAMVDLDSFTRAMERQCRDVSVEAPWEAKNATKLDGTTMETLKHSSAWTNAGKGVIDSTIRAVFCAEPAEISLLYFLWYLHCGGGLQQLIGEEGAAQAECFVGGSQQISDRLAQEFSSRVTINYSCPVDRIERFRNHVVVHSRDGRQFVARALVMALSPPLIAKIRVEPPLSPLRTQLQQRMSMGSILKTFVIYKKPWWRDAGMAGIILSDDGPVTYSYETHDDETGMCALMGFVVGKHARVWMQRSAEERQRAIMHQYARLLGSDKAVSECVGYTEKNWNEEEFSQGCYTANMSPGTLTAFGSTLRKPDGRVFFAGTETAIEWSGYMEGALQAGERAAAEVAYLLNGETPSPELQRLVEQVEDVHDSYTDRVRVDEKSYRRSSVVWKALLGLLGIVIVVIAWVLYRSRM